LGFILGEEEMNEKKKKPTELLRLDADDRNEEIF